MIGNSKDSATPDQSPDFLPKQPKRGRGVRRLNNVPLYAGAAAGALIFSAIGYTAYQRSAMTHQQAARADQQSTEPADPPDLAKPKPKNVGNPPSMPAPPPARGSSPPRHGTAKSNNGDAAKKARAAAWQEYYQEEASLTKQRHDTAVQALAATTSPAGVAAAAPPAASPAGAQMQAPSAAMMAQAVPSGIGGAGYAGGPILPDQSGAQQKLSFMQSHQTMENDVLLTGIQHPLTPYMLMQGGFIPCEMITGENSDAPGQFTGIVTQTVYDSVTGRYPLIPQGSKVVGTYDTQVSAGQDRLPTVIKRIIFPDGDSLDIGGMAGADASGAAGLHDQLNSHFWAKFGNALILAVAGAGAQLMQPQSSYQNGYSAGAIIAGSLGQQFGELGQQTAQSGLAIPNTINVRPGYKFVIQVQKDIPFPGPYHDTQEAPR